MSVKLLIDANLSWRLISLLKDEFSEIEHISNIGLGDSPHSRSVPPSDYLFVWLSHEKI